MTTFETIKAIPDDHPSFPDHFPKNPILPGSILAELVVAAATDAGWRVTSIETIKFARPIRSGGSLRVVLTRNGNAARFECHKEEAVVAVGRLRIDQ